MKVIVVWICYTWAALCQTAPERAVTVCFDRSTVSPVAVAVATTMYDEIGVRLDWRSCRGEVRGAIRISLSSRTPANQMPGALAYTTPYGDRFIRVFYDRVLEAALRQHYVANILLGHVIAHEIGHVLQGVSRHSEDGVTKAIYTTRDMLDMTQKPFSFAPLDRQLIEVGIEAERDRRTRPVTE